ncbi:hypothetical protein BH23ACT9_BH23ACT9_14710 [soil metagenome]
MAANYGRVITDMERPMDDPLLTLQEVAADLRVPLATLYQWRHRGEGPRGIRVGRHVRVRASELERWLDAQADPDPRTAA